MVFLNEQYRKPIDERVIEQFFTQYYKMTHDNYKDAAYDLYLFLKRVPVNKPSCIIMTAMKFSCIPDIFHEYNYTNQLVSLYKTYAITIALDSYVLCNDIDFTVRSEMLVSILNEMELSDFNGRRLLMNNFEYLLDALDYFHPMKLDYDVLFRDEHDVKVFINVVGRSKFTDKRKFEILYVVYKNYIKYTEFTEVFMKNIDHKTKMGIVFNLYPLYKFITNASKYIFGDIDECENEF